MTPEHLTPEVEGRSTAGEADRKTAMVYAGLVCSVPLMIALAVFLWRLGWTGLWYGHPRTAVWTRPGHFATTVLSSSVCLIAAHRWLRLQLPKGLQSPAAGFAPGMLTMLAIAAIGGVWHLSHRNPSMSFGRLPGVGVDVQMSSLPTCVVAGVLVFSALSAGLLPLGRSRVFRRVRVFFAMAGATYGLGGWAIHQALGAWGPCGALSFTPGTHRCSIYATWDAQTPIWQDAMFVNDLVNVLFATGSYAVFLAAIGLALRRVLRRAFAGESFRARS